MEPSLLAPLMLLLAAVVLVPLSWALRRPARARTRALDRFARRVDLPVPDQARPRLERELFDYHLGADLGGAAGFAAVAVWGSTVGRGAVDGGWWLLIAFGGAMSGAAVGAAVAAVRAARRPLPGDAPRVARPTSPTFADYVAPVELQGGRVVAALAVVLAGALVVADGTGALSVGLAPVVTIMAAGGLSLVFAELAGRRVLEAPQAAASDLELAWSDALRAHTLRAVVTVPIVVGTYASVGVLSVLELGDVDPRSIAGILLVSLFGLMLLGVVVALAWTAGGQPHRWFRRRLWPGAGTAPASRRGPATSQGPAR